MDIQVEDLPESQRPVQSPQSMARTDPVAHLALADRFGVRNPSKQEEKQLAEIWAFAKQNANSEDMQDIIWEVVHLEGVIGAPKLGESRLDKLYKYAYLRKQAAQIEGELKDVATNGRLQ